MKRFLNKYTAWFVLWIGVVTVALVLMPNSAQFSTKDTIPNSYQSTKADNISKHWSKNSKSTTDVVAVFSNGDRQLTAKQNKAIDKTISRLKRDKKQYQITDITDAASSSIAKSQLISKDKTTEIVQISLRSKQGVEKIKSELTPALQTTDVDTYLTGSDIIGQDFSDNTQKGVQKTEIIAIVFIFIVLLLVFRSPITPIISLVTVGIAGVISLSIVFNLVKYFGFPYSDFTEVFIIIVLFGIGTDYNILLYNEFKQNMLNGMNKKDAARKATKIGGKTVLYSGISVLIGMSTLFLAKFYLYRSAAGIAIGVAILLLILLTLNPFFMSIMGSKMFWPMKKVSGEGESKLWGNLSRIAILRPILTVILMVLIFVPIAVQSHGNLSYNDAIEVSDKIPSKQGYNLIQKHFSKGTVEPTSIYIKSKQPLNNQENLQLIDQITRQLKHVDGVKTVMSASQPGGKEIKELYVKNQMATVTSGITSAKKGLNQIHSGLSSAKEQIDAANVGESVSSAQELDQGSQEVASGTSELSNGINEVTSGIQQLNQQLSANAGSDQQAQLKQLESALPELNSAINELNQQVNSGSDSSNSVTTHLTSIGNYASDIGNQLDKINQSMGTVQDVSVDGSEIVKEIKATGVSMTDQQAQQIANGINEKVKQQSQAANALQQQLSGSLTKIGQDAVQIGTSDQSVATELQTLDSSTASLQEATNQLANASNQLLPSTASAIQSLSSGLSQLSTGTVQLSTAMGTMNSQTGALVSGANQVASGNHQMATELQDLTKQVFQLSSGLGEANDGLSEEDSGLGDANSYLNKLRKSSAAKTYYIPKKELNGTDFKPVLETYFSSDKKTTQLTVVLADDPSSMRATKRLGVIEQVVKGSLRGTKLKNAEIAIGGTTSLTKDLNDIATKDFKRTAVLMLVGIMIALLFVTRSLIQSLVIEGILLLVYYTALNIVHWLSSALLGQSMLTWNTPFFAFIMLIALGVDYSIFLMTKFRETLHEPISIDAKVLKATSMIGAVVISAGVILGGTFAAMIPSGVLTLIQVALVVIIGIVLLVLLIPIVLPAVMKITYPTPKSRIVDKNLDKNH